jgi:hypothetical protein
VGKDTKRYFVLDAAITAFGGEYLWMQVQLQVSGSSLKRTTNLERKEG